MKLQTLPTHPLDPDVTLRRADGLHVAIDLMEMVAQKMLAEVSQVEKKQRIPFDPEEVEAWARQIEWVSDQIQSKVIDLRNSAVSAGGQP